VALVHSFVPAEDGVMRSDGDEFDEFRALSRRDHEELVPGPLDLAQR
jgi:hypothetical protein